MSFNRTVFQTMAAGICACATLAAMTGGAWPGRVFAPYVFLGARDHFKLAECWRACGQKYYTIAFIIADKERRPSWYGRAGMDENLYADDIATVRKTGGDVIVSFGGADGTEMAIAETNAATLEHEYQSVIERYKLTWLDFDIEGSALSNAPANARRNLVLARLEDKNPGLRISYTLPVDPKGIPKAGRQLLANARDCGMQIYSVNVMTMDYGAVFSKGKKMSDVSMASALKAHEQCRQISPDLRLGLTPMIGKNDQPGEIFTAEDARALLAWAREQPWICSLSFWSSNRDMGRRAGANGNWSSGIDQEPWEFTKIFRDFTTADLQ